MFFEFRRLIWLYSEFILRCHLLSKRTSELDGLPFLPAYREALAKEWVITVGYYWDPHTLLSFYWFTLAGIRKFVLKTSIFVINWRTEINLLRAGR